MCICRVTKGVVCVCPRTKVRLTQSKQQSDDGADDGDDDEEEEEEEKCLQK